MTGERISAQRAYELGFVNRVVEHGKALEAALELAQSICVNAPLAVQASKRIANGIIEGQVSAEDAAWALNDTETRAVMTSATRRKGRSPSPRSETRSGRRVNPPGSRAEA